jgi:hypothetical protein
MIEPSRQYSQPEWTPTGPRKNGARRLCEGAPAHKTQQRPPSGREKAHQSGREYGPTYMLLRRMLNAGLSRYTPDPVKALKDRRKAKNEV